MRGVDFFCIFKRQRRKETVLTIEGIDRIEGWDKEGIVGKKTVHADEEYFQDHFPDFPVLPGVMMLESLVQLASWHVQRTEGFVNSQIDLTHCAHVKYSRLVTPPAQIRLECKLLGRDPEYEYSGKVSQDGRTAMSARFKVRSSSLVQSTPYYGHLEGAIDSKNRRRFEQLTGHLSG